MSTGSEALIFFYGVFWATVVSSASRYRPFETADLFSADPPTRKMSLRRMLWSLLLLNGLPITNLTLLYSHVVPVSNNGSAIASAAFGGLSVFAYTRLLHAILATDAQWHRYFTPVQYENFSDQYGRQGSPKTARAHAIPGLAYLALFTLLACLFGTPR